MSSVVFLGNSAIVHMRLHGEHGQSLIQANGSAYSALRHTFQRYVALESPEVKMRCSPIGHFL
eukprot:1140771-Pelagomonas_calceolata.AAC.8